MSKPTIRKCEARGCTPGDGDEAIKECVVCRRGFCDLCAYDVGEVCPTCSGGALRSLPPSPPPSPSDT